MPHATMIYESSRMEYFFRSRSVSPFPSDRELCDHADSRGSKTLATRGSNPLATTPLHFRHNPPLPMHAPHR